MNAYEQPKTGIPMGIPIPVLILIAVTLVMSVIARKHRFGRHVFAHGRQPESAELAGIDTNALTVLVFVTDGPSLRARLDRDHRAANAGASAPAR